MNKKQTIPSSVAKFCAINTPYHVLNDSVFIEAMRDITRWHQSQCVWYASYLNMHQVDVEAIQSLSDLENLPCVHANF